MDRFGECVVIAAVTLTLAMCLYGCVRDLNKPKQTPIMVEQLSMASKIVCE